jgi:hypothetical protein
VTCYDSLRIHQNRVVKAELRDAGSDLGDLGVRVRPWVPGPGDQPINEPHLDVLGHSVDFRDCRLRHSFAYERSSFYARL